MPNLQILKRISEEKNVTLRKIAEISGMTEQGLHKAINKDDIKFSALDKIASFLKVSLYTFSDFTNEVSDETKVSVNGINSGNVAGGNIIQVTLPEAGQQKIIKPDGETIIESISPNEKRDFNMEDKSALLEKIGLQQELIDSLKDQLAMYKEKYK